MGWQERCEEGGSLLVPAGSLAERICALIRLRSRQAWLVGGYVRDRLLGRVSHDLDFVVPRGGLALARRVADHLSGAFYALDAERDVGRAILRDTNGATILVDIARWRSDDLRADLVARDFTVNALAYDIVNRGEIIDPTGGLADLRAGVLRGPSSTVFQEDPIRLLRAVRLEAQLGFHLEPATESWLRRDASLLRLTAAERIRDEMVRLLTLPEAARHLARLEETGLLTFVLPELAACRGVHQSPPHHFDVYEHTLEVVRHTEALLRGLEVLPGDKPTVAASPLAPLPPPLQPIGERLKSHLMMPTSGGRHRGQVLLWAALAHDWAKPLTQSVEQDGRIRFIGHEEQGAEMAAMRLATLCFSAEEVERVALIVRQHMRPSLLARAGGVTRRAIYRFFRDASDAGPDVLLLSLADHLGTHGPDLDRQVWEERLALVARMLAAYFDEREIVEPRPLLSGDDLMAVLSIAPGPLVGELLMKLREAQAAGEVSSREEAVAFLRSQIGESQKP